MSPNKGKQPTFLHHDHVFDVYTLRLRLQLRNAYISDAQRHFAHLQLNKLCMPPQRADQRALQPLVASQSVAHVFATVCDRVRVLPRSLRRFLAYLLIGVGVTSPRGESWGSEAGQLFFKSRGKGNDCFLSSLSLFSAAAGRVCTRSADNTAVLTQHLLKVLR